MNKSAKRFRAIRTGTVVALVLMALVAQSSAKAATTFAPIRMVVGSPITDTYGHKWVSEYGAVGGKVVSTTADIAGTTDDRLYQRERYNVAGYNIPISTAGTFRVKLRLAEIYFGAPNKRVFNVKSEGVTVAQDLDIFARAGGKNRAYELQFDTKVSDGNLDLDFVNKVNYAKISSIEITAVSLTGTTTTSPVLTTTSIAAPVTTTTTKAPVSTTLAPTTTTIAAPATGFFGALLPSAPVLDPNSAAIARVLGQQRLSLSTGDAIPVYKATSTTRSCTVQVTENWGGADNVNPLSVLSNRIYADPSWKPQGPSFTNNVADDDWYVYNDPRGYTVHLWYELNWPGDNADLCAINPKWGGVFRTSDMTKPAALCGNTGRSLCGDGSGSGISAVAGQIKRSELVAGRITHKMQFATNFTKTSVFHSPAWKTDGLCRYADGKSCAEFAIPEGATVFLDRSFNVDAVTCADLEAWICDDANGGNQHLRTTKIILKGLQEFGAVVTDKNGNCASDAYGPLDSGRLADCGGGGLTIEPGTGDLFGWDYSGVTPKGLPYRILAQ